MAMKIILADDNGNQEEIGVDIVVNSAHNIDTGSQHDNIVDKSL